MKLNFNPRIGILSSVLCCLLLTVVALGQSAPNTISAPVPAAETQKYSVQGQSPSIEPVSYASVSQLNGMLSQLEATAKNTQDDLVKLRIEHWKTDNGSKRQALANVDSIQRNLQGALPQIIAQLRGTPEDVPATFKLYRNLDALYDVLGSVVESTGAFGTKDDLQTLSNDLNAFEGTRKQMAERIESLSAMKEAEITRLRADLKTAQAAIPAPPPKKTIVDDTEPPKKPVVKKKPAPKTGATSSGQGSAKPAAGQNPPAPQQTKPQ